MAQTAEKMTALEVHEGQKTIEYIPFGADEKLTLTLNLIRDHIAVPTKSGVKPNKSDCYHFGMLCKARAMNPWEGDCFMIPYENRKTGVITWNLITAHQTFLKRAELHPEHDGMESGVIVREENGDVMEYPGDLVLDGQTLLAGWAKVFSKDKSHYTYRRLDLKVYAKAYGYWLANPAGQIVKCAEADALRSAYPTKLGGLYLREEMGKIERGEQTAIPAPEAEGGVKVDIEPEEKTATEALAEKVSETSDVEIIDELDGSELGPPPLNEKALLERIEKIENGFELRAWKKKHQAEIKALSPAIQKKIGAALTKRRAELMQPAPKPTAKPKPNKTEEVDELFGMILQMANGDRERAMKVLSRYMKKAGRNTEGKNSYADLDVPDKNCIRPYVEADFNAQNGIAEPRMGLGE